MEDDMFAKFRHAESALAVAPKTELAASVLQDISPQEVEATRVSTAVDRAEGRLDEDASEASRLASEDTERLNAVAEEADVEFSDEDSGGWAAEEQTPCCRRRGSRWRRHVGGGGRHGWRAPRRHRRAAGGITWLGTGDVPHTAKPLARLGQERYGAAAAAHGTTAIVAVGYVAAERFTGRRFRRPGRDLQAFAL